ncbi:DUF6636 domain-containing protein [Wenxinia saemankumensis]|uniref:Uncharacterized protein n=1 Tax=Wenxinia saemankumensis TaxID=1447782 RepID=A0A1M6HGP5_9RHOB|nr:DUF6636 domain-containing protein [Wenxinia saemankumensis]SHJ21361.1 hypothetical protein SAMN05444417_3221 [Wenxinia saemankumensis]
MRLTGAAIVVACSLTTAATAQDYLSFQSPSGNIHCMIGAANGGSATCDIFRFTPSFPSRPAWCDGDWGGSFSVSAGSAGSPGCYTDSRYNPTAQILAYGQSISVGAVTCTSRESGMTCVNRGGHGFTLRRAQQSVF